jgi:hypothetical protein
MTELNISLPQPRLQIVDALKARPTDQAGVRLHGVHSLQPLLNREGTICAIPAKVLGHRSRPVRAILFDKTPGTNWSLAWHQDLTICVKQRIDVEGYGPWTTKGGMQHVAPPFELLARMITVRLHLDDVPPENSPLLIAPGSHFAGRVPISESQDIVARCGTFTCLADAGDVWIYATPILHASEAARITSIVAFYRSTIPQMISAGDWNGSAFEAASQSPKCMKSRV